MFWLAPLVVFVGPSAILAYLSYQIIVASVLISK